MIDWLQQLDVSLFRFVNGSLSNPVFDWIMPQLSTPPFASILVAAAFILLIWKGGTRGRICAVALLLALWLGDTILSNSLKHAIGRIRPLAALADVHLRTGIGSSFSMPSSHAVNWFSATVVVFIFYRRSLRIMLPLALAVSFSRIYNGAHYPSDVLAGMILGSGTGAFVVWMLEALWKFFGKKFFPLWWEKLPSLMNPEMKLATAESGIQKSEIENQKLNQHWLRLGYVVIAVLLLARLFYLASNTIELSEDEAYQWIWSKHPALSYFSKPPFIAYVQFLGTHLWGDTQFGVRFFSPVIAAVLSLLLLRFFAREISAKTGLVFVLVVNATPLMALGSTVMTIDPLCVLFWTAAMMTGWRAVQPTGTTGQWCLTGLWMGCGFLSKYTALFQLLCWVVFFCLWPESRKHLRRPGPYLALLINALCSVPVLIWNSQHHWITVEHVANNGNLNAPFELKFDTVRDFILSEFGLLHPVFFVAMVWAAFAFWRRDRRNAMFVYFFSMGAPVILFYLLLSFQSGIFPNWIAPAVLPMFCLTALYWRKRWPANSRTFNTWLAGAIIVGASAVVLAHNTDLTKKMFHRALPANIDPLHRVHGWKHLAATIGAARTQLETEGKPTFVIGGHYGFTSLVTFYLPEAKRCVETKPLVYVISSDHPQNQFYFWPNYLDRKGENAIFFREVHRPALREGWFGEWINGGTNLFSPDKPVTKPLPPQLVSQFESIEELGIQDVVYDNRIMHRVQLFACRKLK